MPIVRSQYLRDAGQPALRIGEVRSGIRGVVIA